MKKIDEGIAEGIGCVLWAVAIAIILIAFNYVVNN